MSVQLASSPEGMSTAEHARLVRSRTLADRYAALAEHPFERRGTDSTLRALALTIAATVLVVAYRMATILLADEVVYVEAGRVVDHGRHAELMGRCAGYEHLVTAYAREAAEREAIAAGAEDLDEYDLDEAEDGRDEQQEAVR